MKLNIEKINKYYKNTYLILLTLAIYILLALFKTIYYNLFNININNLTNIEKTILIITYQTFAIAVSLNFFLQHKNDTIEQLEKYKTRFTIGVSTIIIYILQPFLETLILFIEKINPQTLGITSKAIYLTLFELTTMLIIILINNKKLKKDIKDYKKNWKQYLEKYLPYYILSLIIMITSNIIINRLTGTIAGNEQAIENTLTKAPVYIFISSVIIAPFMEEMVFRQSLKNIIIDKKAFIIASGLIFGLLHVIGNITTIYDVLYIIPYGTPGLIFAIMLTKTNNIFVSMSIHFLHNLLLMTLKILILL